MSEGASVKRVVVRPDIESIVDTVGSAMVTRLLARQEEGLVSHISLTGGSTGVKTLRGSLDDPRSATVDWSKVHFWWSDERFVPRGDPERNDTDAFTEFFSPAAVPEANIHSFPGSTDGLSLDEAADAYTAELAAFAMSEEQPWPSFDICFLGVGPDGHIASLFPDRPEIRITDRVVVPVEDSPKPPPTRLTLTRGVINSSQRVWLVMAGAEKASALGLALAGVNVTSVPVAGAQGRRSTVFFVDAAAAANVPPDLIDGSY